MRLLSTVYCLAKRVIEPNYNYQHMSLTVMRLLFAVCLLAKSVIEPTNANCCIPMRGIKPTMSMCCICVLT